MSDSVKNEVLEFIRINGRRPSQVRREEKRLHTAMTNRISPMSAQFDAEFRDKLEALSPQWKAQSDAKARVMDFIVRHGRRPSAVNPAERKMSEYMYRYVSPIRATYDPAFKAAVDRIAKGKNQPEDRKAKIIEFITKYGRTPKERSKSPYERNLFKHYKNYVHESCRGYDPLFVRVLASTFGIKIETKKDIKARVEAQANAILNHIRATGRPPRKGIVSERKLANLFSNYMIGRGGPAGFREKVEKLLKRNSND
jgi:hypothetical protein